MEVSLNQLFFSLMPSRIKALIKEIPIKIIINENGIAPTIIADWMALSPPANNRAAITAVKMRPQIIMWCFVAAS